MKFLCLHGMGANSQVLAIQIAAIRTRLGPQHEYVFVDGQERCEPDAQVRRVSPGPYLCYYTSPTVAKIGEAYALIHEVVKEEGPFDGVIGFSQGAALASSMILQQARENPSAAPLFPMAVFLCASLPYDVGSDPIRQDQHFSSKSGITTAPNGFPDLLTDGAHILQQYDPDTSPWRIAVPTLHVIGKGDGFRPQSERLIKLCTEDAVLAVHEGGHLIPKDPHFTAKVVRQLETIIGRIQCLC